MKFKSYKIHSIGQIHLEFDVSFDCFSFWNLTKFMKSLIFSEKQSFIFSENLSFFIRNLTFLTKIGSKQAKLGPNWLFFGHFRPILSLFRIFPAVRQTIWQNRPQVASFDGSNYFSSRVYKSNFISRFAHSRNFSYWGLGRNNILCKI